MSARFSLSEQRALAEQRIEHLLDRLMYADEAEAASIHAAIARLNQMLSQMPKEEERP